MAVKGYILLLGILFASSCAFAQEGQTDTLRNAAVKLDLLKLNNNWLRSTNAAGMQWSDIFAIGKTGLSYNNLEGQFKLVQQPESQQQIHFASERYQPIGNALFFGSFAYTKQNDKNVRLSDVLDPYRGTPYLLADSIGGNWRKQLYALKLKAASPKLWNDKLVLGMGLNLDVATGARQNDPRPLSTSNQISVTPGLTWKQGAHSVLGVNALYGRYREEISLEVKNTNISHYLYKFLGVGQYELPGIFSVGSSRVYNGDKYGADLQYELRTADVNWLTTVGYHTYEEEVADGSTAPRKAGTWKQKAYNISSRFNLNSARILHQVSFTGQLVEDTGVEFHEYYNTSTKSWQTILEAPFYSAESVQAELRYTLLQKSDVGVYKWLAEVAVQYQSYDKNYSVPAALDRADRVGFGIKASRNFLMPRSANLQASLALNYSLLLNDAISFIAVTGDRNMVAREVLYPDHAYLTADRITATANLQYNFHLNKVKNTQFFVGSVLNVLHAMNAENVYQGASGSRRFLNLSLGAFY
ncbi:hypothetical protein LPB86_16415 [Pedobacter sp. MC2016-14]|uniref:DUF6850 family outer membrane beta-barrel protein n=1 Tax=Pedobacter sp. MC2016-14 TaxID=2897327 RepID=UPI001E3EDE1A|nr:DUF6850 family outer membrane beta-barrel protein [Pedobacter sp. MC2016-14]MCD0489829.1 hypothetical protein [Pedobacter sp. MC2016-14]